MAFTTRFPRLLILLSLSLALSACAMPGPVGQDAPNFQKVILRDVQALRGGRVVTLESDGALDVRIVAPGGAETHATFLVSPAKASELSKLLEEHHFSEIEIEFRAPVPDEARPEIEVVWSSGRRTVVAKWANDVHPDFDAVYNWLLELSDEMMGSDR